MKKRSLPILAVALASCAPTVQQDPSYSASRTYQASCAQTLTALDDVAIRTRPAVLFGANTWSPLSVVSRSENRVTYASRNGSAVITYGVVQPLNLTVTTTATCTEANGTATLTLTSSGQTQRAITALHTALFEGVTMPK